MDYGDAMGGKGGKANSMKKLNKGETASSRSHAHLHPQSHPFAHQPPGGGTVIAVGTEGRSGCEGDQNSNVAALRLRGLPFTMSEQDVLAFFSQHDVADCIAEISRAAQLLPKANGRPSGQARVQMRSRRDAEIAQSALDRQWIGGRYIEVFVYGDEADQEANGDTGYGWSQADPLAGDPMAAWQKQAFSNFPTMPFGGGFGGPPPWAMGMPPPPVPGTGPDGVPDATTRDLFSFLLPEPSDTLGSQPPLQDSPPRNAVQV
jgi:hypothetical protein